MSQILNSLVVAKGLETQYALEQIMENNLAGHVLSLVTYSLDSINKIDRAPDLIFIVNQGEGLTAADVHKVTEAFPRCTSVVLDDDPESMRGMFIKAGVDEVMSLADLRSPLGRHMLEKIIAFRDLAAAEARVEASEERFRGIIEHSNDIILLLDTDGSILYASPAFARQLGYELWTVLGQDFFGFVHEEGREQLRFGFRELMMLPPTESTSLEFLFRHKKDHYLTMEATGSNLLRNPTVQAVVLHLRDVTAQKHAEVELKIYRLHLEDLVEQRTREAEQANKRADMVIAASPDALIAMDENGIITFASRHYRTLYPASAQLMSEGNNVMEAFEVVTREVGLRHDDERYIDMKEWWKKPKGYKEFKMDNGTWVRLQARRIPETNGIVVSTTNITDYKRQQALLAAQQAELEAALAKEKSIVEQQRTFVSMVSHEFRTPLTVIDGNAQIIHSRGDTIGKEALQKRAVNIRSSVDRLVRLIETILSTHMLDAGKLVVEPKPCDLAKLIREVCADQQDISPNHKIKVEARGLPDTIVLDAKLIRQALANLVSNAVKYSPKSDAVEISAFKEGDYAVIEVQDHGVGIPAEEIPHVFSKYFRASTSSGIPGSGLGLSVVQHFVELHHGTVALRSKVGIGTVVTMSLPLGEGKF
jgi:PAS domain S-box-containing protein